MLRPPASLTRRGLLRTTAGTAVLGALAALTAACTPDRPALTPPAPSSSPSTGPDPDTAATQASVTRERLLLAAYRTESVRLPHLAAELKVFADQHVAHLSALGEDDQPLAVPAVPQRPDRSPAAVAARRRLAQLERRAADGHAGDAARASTRLAPLLASLCASESAHAAVL